MEKTISQHKNDIIEICRRVYANGWVAANDGNISIKLDSNTVLCTPTGMSKGYLTTDELIKVDMEGNKIDGHMEPSSEAKMHIDVYKNKPGINSVVHAHPPYATGFAVAGLPLDQCVMPEIIVGLGSIPLTKFGTPSTMEIPENVRPYLKEYNVFLLENHGALSVGSDVYQAYYRMESLELFAKISLFAKLAGKVQVLSEEDTKKVMEIRKQFNLPEENYPGCRIDSKIVKPDDSYVPGAGNTERNGNSGQSTVCSCGGAAASSGDKIEITRDKLVELVTLIVSNVVKNLKQ
ncbi:MAG: class II aldolase/adducin family protein [Actinobacteria bacterium]|nr:class II aldolase/adducin family protein [Actinomycetota bacterium]